MKLITIIHLTEAAVVWKLEKTGVVQGRKCENRQPHEVIYRKEKVTEWQKWLENIERAVHDCPKSFGQS